MATASATGYLKLDINGFQEAISSAKRLLGGLAAAFGAFKVAQYFKNGISDAITFGHEIHQASMKMGKMDPGKLLLSQKVLERMGLGADEARAQLQQLVETGRPLSTMFRTAADYASAMSTAKSDYGSQAAILSKSAKDFNAAFYTLKSIGDKLKTLFLAATSGFIKPLRGVLDELNKMDFAKQAESIGKSVGDAMAKMLKLFKDGTLWDYAKDGLTLAFLTSVKYLWEGVQSVATNAMQWFSDAFVSSVEFLKQALDAVFSNNWFQLLWSRFKAFFLGIGSNIAGWMGMGDLENSLADSALAADTTGNDIFDKIKRNIGASNTGGNNQPSYLDAKIAALIDSMNKLTGGNDFSYLKNLYKKEPEEGIRDALGAQEPLKILSDSLQSVGGGGGFITASLSPEAKEAMKANQQLKVLGEKQDETNDLLRGMSGLGKPMADNRGMTGLGNSMKDGRGMSGLGKSMKDNRGMGNTMLMKK